MTLSDLVSVEDVAARLPDGIDRPNNTQLGVLIGDAVDEIEVAFARAGRDFAAELESTVWLSKVAARVVREMVSAVVLVGPNAGVRSVSSTTGPVSDSVTYADVGAVGWAGVRLTALQRLELGLADGGPRGRFPEPVGWPEVIVDVGDRDFPRWAGYRP